MVFIANESASKIETKKEIKARSSWVKFEIEFVIKDKPTFDSASGVTKVAGSEVFQATGYLTSKLIAEFYERNAFKTISSWKENTRDLLSQAQSWMDSYIESYK